MATKRNPRGKRLKTRYSQLSFGERAEIHKPLLVHYTRALKNFMDEQRFKTGCGGDLIRRAVNLEFAAPYTSKKFGRCSVHKVTVENWLHERHCAGEIDHRWIDDYVGGSVNVNQVFDDEACRSIPWGPTHDVGSILWSMSLKVLGLANASDIQSQDLSRIRNYNDFVNTMVLLEEGRLKIDPRFVINPGEHLDFEV